MTQQQERDEELEKLLEFLRDERGFDFTGYKRPSLSRRIAKRLQDRKIASFAEYRHTLEREPDEFAALFDTILINVTSFFRDGPAWEYVTREIVPRILDARHPGDPIRIWSTGCATGEEAFTLAIVLAEAMGEEDFRRRVKIYATDVDEGALSDGRHASYSPQQLESIPGAFRERYFEQTNASYVFRADLRRSVIFGRHDLVQDPPISRIDLLVSRNTLMYFDAETQRRVLANFHFALRDDGFLFLGKSEVLVARSPLFSAVDLKRRVFAKVATVAPRERLAQPQRDDPGGDAVALLASAGLLRDAGFEAAPLAQVVVDRAGRLALANMQARMLFGLGQRDLGALLQDLELSYRPIELRSRIEQVYAEGHAISLRDVDWQGGGETRTVDVQLSPLVSTAGELVGVGVSFADVTRYRRLQDALEASKREVETAYEELQSTVEELETTNEELQSTNEELETTNEELQSTNEELETMNEELQSTNEELETMNDELQQRTDELNDANSFLEAILGGLTAGVVVVDTELRVQAWNEASEGLWGLRADEVENVHLLNLDVGLPVDELRKPLRTALAGELPEPVSLDAVNRRGRAVRCTVRVGPLASDGSDVRGAIVVVEADPVAEG